MSLCPSLTWWLGVKRLHDKHFTHHVIATRFRFDVIEKDGNMFSGTIARPHPWQFSKAELPSHASYIFYPIFLPPFCR